MQTYDKLWKGIVEDLFEDFLHFFYPNWVHLIDFSKGFQFLDQELAQLFPEAEQNNRTIDKLVKVYLLDGKEEWILIHIEIQGYQDENFEQRMFVYFYRILDRYQKRISALAIFTDNKKSYAPNQYYDTCFGTEISYKFPTYKIIQQKKSTLLKSENPFALVVLATQAAIQKGKMNDDAIMSIKRNLVRMLYKRNYEKKKIISLFKFIQHYIRFENPNNYAIFANEIISIYEPNQKNMGVIEILVEDARQEGIEKGINLGIEKGIDLGIEKGIEKGINLGVEKGINLGIEKGIDLGVEKGIDLGVEKNKVDTVKNILQKFSEWENEIIADLAGVSVDFVVSIRSEKE